MLENQVTIFSILAVIVFVLATYLGFLLNKIRIQKSINQANQQQLEKLKQDRENSVKESLEIIAKAVIQKQCEISEGCIRIKKLMDSIDMYQGFDGHEVFDKMYDEIKDFAILEERKKLTKQEKFTQDNQRFAIEKRYETQISHACVFN
jgi:hypothetical protein